MSRTVPVLALIALLSALSMWNPNQADTPAKPQRLLRHVVLFKFKATATPEQIRKIETEFAALPKKIDAIQAFEWGTNNSPEGLDRGYTHCFLVTFKSEEDRQTYLVHPEHKKFVEILLPLLEEPHVIDYWTAS